MEQQSPIDIAGYVPGGAPQLSFEYGGNAECLTNTGEFVKALYEDGGGIQLGDGFYRVVEAHFHNPSEHTVEGRRFALETHLVHRRESEIAVVGILYRLGSANAAIQAVIEAAPGQGEADVPVSGLPASDLPSVGSRVLWVHGVADHSPVHGGGEVACAVGGFGCVGGAGGAAGGADWWRRE